MGAGISPMGMNMSQQPQGQGKGGGGRSAVNQQLMSTLQRGFADPFQASQQRMAQDPNANMMRTQPGLPLPPVMARAEMSIDEFSRSGMMGPTTQEFRNPIEFEGSMRDPELVRRHQQYMGGGQQQQRLENETFGPVPDSMRQMPIGGFGQPDQASMQAQINDLARRRADPYAMQMQMEADALQGRRQAPPFQTQINQADQARRMYPAATNMQMEADQAAMQMQADALQGRRLAPQMNEQIRMQQMQQRQMPFQMQPQMNNPMFGGLGALMAMRGFGGGFSQPMGGFGGYGGGFGGYGGGFGSGFGGGFGSGFGGKGGGGFSQPQRNSPFGAAMGRGLGGLAGFFR